MKAKRRHKKIVALPKQLNIFQKAASDPDLVNPAREAKRDVIKIGCNGVVAVAGLTVAFLIAGIIHYAVVFARWAGWPTPSWLEWTDSLGLAFFFVACILISLVLLIALGLRLLRKENVADSVTDAERVNHEQK